MSGAYERLPLLNTKKRVKRFDFEEMKAEVEAYQEMRKKEEERLIAEKAKEMLVLKDVNNSLDVILEKFSLSDIDYVAQRSDSMLGSGSPRNKR